MMLNYIKIMCIKQIPGKYGHKVNTRIADGSNDHVPWTPDKESVAENADNITETSHSTHNHYIPLP